MQALASSRGVRIAPLRATSHHQHQHQQQQLRGRVAVAKITAISSRTNAFASDAARRPTRPRAAFVVAAAAPTNNVPLVTRDEGPVSEEAFSVR